MPAYAQKRAARKWGVTAAYKEFAEKTKNYTKEKQNEVTTAIDGIMAEFAECAESGFTPESGKAQALVKKLQDFITENCYNCTKEVLSGLGEMYTADERFTKNIDRHGSGTAEFISRAVKVYCTDQTR